ncbi:DUF6328 family protein [Janibacter sp. Y6]|uniref:DUF6328 family protein n=1 Tax=Janibacter sp. Y6 TaxID=2913552 RepID=UPI0034A2EB0E
MATGDDERTDGERTDDGRDVAPGDGRDETATERFDRNWEELLQELRVVQTGVQILAGFLLTLPFQARFTVLEPHHRVIYLVAFCLALLATALLAAPVSAHRLLFRRHAKRELVAFGNRCAQGGMVSLALSLLAVLYLIVEVLLGTPAAVTAIVVGAAVFLALWVMLPMRMGRAAGHAGSPPPSRSSS